MGKLLLMACLVFISSCDGPPAVQAASRHYQAHRDFYSLSVITESLHTGMSRHELDLLLGPADYSPTDGIYYYSTDKTVFVEGFLKDVTVGLVVDFHDKQRILTNRLQSYSLGPIGE